MNSSFWWYNLIMTNYCSPFGREIDVAQYIYEMIALSVPLRRVHPGVQDGSLKQKRSG
jgi:uncharacterized metal-binding protein YceD (DUF177 family)